MKPWYVSTNVLVWGYPGISPSHISSYLGISHLFLLNFKLSRNIPPVFVSFWDIPEYFWKRHQNWDIPSFVETSSFWTCISQFGKRYPWITRHVTYPGISLRYFVWNRILRVNLTKPYLYQLFAFPTEKSKQLGYIGTNVIVFGYPWIGHMSSYSLISHLSSFNFGISWDRLG